MAPSSGDGDMVVACGQMLPWCDGEGTALDAHRAPFDLLARRIVAITTNLP